MNTYSPKQSDITPNWYLVDAKNKILGRLAAKVAAILRGKHKAIFSPHVDCGDHVIIINAKDIKVTGRKLAQKKYYRHSGYPDGFKIQNLGEMMLKNPTKALETAIKRMVPRNRLRNHVLGKLKIYADDQHPHIAQTPKPLNI